MALPLGTFGWLGSGFDCTCDCMFEGGFEYNGNEPANWGFDPPPICLLMFAVGNLRNGCTVINVEDANITIVLKKNGVVISEPVLIDSVNNIIYWERFKPDAGDVYTADVTLDCGYGNTFTRSFSYTIPTPANVNCTCCTDRTPDYLTVSGFTGRRAILNGTWALISGGIAYRDPVAGGLDKPYCSFQPVSQPVGEPQPTDPCSGTDPLLLHQCDDTASPPRTFYFYPAITGGATIYAWTPNGFSIAAGYTKVRVHIRYTHNVWRYWVLSTPNCVNTNFLACAAMDELWEFEIDCNSGTTVLLGYHAQSSPDTTLLTSDTPSVSFVFQ